MGRINKKGERGQATLYLTRNQAMRKLQLTYKNFRRLCILKGIYPHEPKNKKKVLHGSTANKTFYYVKDIQFLAHEPIIQKYRQIAILTRKIKKAVGKRDKEFEGRCRENMPLITYDHIVKERYPTFNDALRDIDDALCLCFLFSTFPNSKATSAELSQLCSRLTVEFMHYVIESRSLRKVFISIKGYYYQAEICGETVTWLVPHKFSYKNPTDVDFQIMTTFTHFYTALLGFVNYKLYHSLNLHYPPTVSANMNLCEDIDFASQNENTSERVAALNQNIVKKVSTLINEDADQELTVFPLDESTEQLEKMRKEQEKIKKLEKLFSKFKFFIGREVPREPITFLIRCFGGQVSWDSTTHIGATYKEEDKTITHQIVDRPVVDLKYLSRYYVQPQWLFDCVNARMLLPVANYFPGVELPPHLSPFVEETDNDYIPPEKQDLIELQEGRLPVSRFSETKNVQQESDDETNDKVSNNQNDSTELGRNKLNKAPIKKKQNMQVSEGKITEENTSKKKFLENVEEKKLAVMMIPKKKKRVYQKMMYGQRRKNRQVENLKNKRQQIDQQRQQRNKI